MRILLILAALVSLAAAREITFSWNPPPLPQSFELQIREGQGEWKPVGSTETIQLTAVFPDGEFEVRVIGFHALKNSAGEDAGRLVSEPSETIVIPPSLEKPKLRVVVIQTSADLQRWRSVAYVPLDPASGPQQFVRAGLATITP